MVVERTVLLVMDVQTAIVAGAPSSMLRAVSVARAACSSTSAWGRRDQAAAAERLLPRRRERGEREPPVWVARRVEVRAAGKPASFI